MYWLGSPPQAADVNAETTADVPGTEESREKEPAKDEQPAESKGSDAPAGPSEKHDAEVRPRESTMTLVPGKPK